MKKTLSEVGIGVSKQERKSRRWLIALVILKIVAEMFMSLYILGGLFEIFHWIPVFLSLGASAYLLFTAFSHQTLTKRLAMICQILQYGSPVTILILGCILLYGGNFGAGHAPVFFFVSALIFGLTLIQRTLHSGSSHKNETQRYSKKQVLVTLVIGVLLFTSSLLFTNYKMNVDNPPRYSQEDLDGATIAYVNVEITATLAPYEINVFKTWHAGEDYLTALFILTTANCNVYCSHISDKQLTRGSVSIGDGRTTIEMTDNEGWVYFIVGWSQNDEEFDPENSEWRTDLPANYSFTITSNHLNYHYPV